MRVHAHQQGHRARTEQGRRRNDANLQRRVAELQQVQRQQQADEPVAEGAQPFGGEEAVYAA